MRPLGSGRRQGHSYFQLSNKYIKKVLTSPAEVNDSLRLQDSSYTVGSTAL